MLTRGSSAHTKASFAEDVESMGGRFESTVDREQTRLTMTVHKGDVGRAVSLLGDAVSSATLDSAEVEFTKQEIAREHDVSNRDQMRVTLEQSHYNCFRDHMMGQPIAGDADLVQNLNVDALRDYRAANYFGYNIVVVGT